MDDEGDRADVGETTDEPTVPSDLPDVPQDPDAAVADDDHALALDDLQYPEFVFDSGEVADDGRFDLETDLDREGMQAWLADLAGGLASHDVAVESPAGRVTLGVAARGAEMRFDPDEDDVGEFEVAFRMRAKAMVVNDADDPKVGARGGRGFVPLAMLTDDDRDPGDFRCYNWIEDPTDG